MRRAADGVKPCGGQIAEVEAGLRKAGMPGRLEEKGECDDQGGQQGTGLHAAPAGIIVPQCIAVVGFGGVQ